MIFAHAASPKMFNIQTHYIMFEKRQELLQVLKRANRNIQLESSRRRSFDEDFHGAAYLNF